PGRQKNRLPGDARRESKARSVTSVASSPGSRPRTCRGRSRAAISESRMRAQASRTPALSHSLCDARGHRNVSGTSRAREGYASRGEKTSPLQGKDRSAPDSLTLQGVLPDELERGGGGGPPPDGC